VWSAKIVKSNISVQNKVKKTIILIAF